MQGAEYGIRSLLQEMNTLSKNIILTSGDSWAAGEWLHRDHPDSDDPTYGGVYKNFVEYGYQVINLSKPGGSNLESVDRVKDYLRCNRHLTADIKFILFWQSEWFREIWYYRQNSLSLANLDQELKHGYAIVKDHWIYRPYYILSELSQQWQIPIYVIGGASDTIWYDDFEKDFPGVKITCQSATNLIFSNDHRIDEPVFCQFIPGWIDEGGFLDKIKKNISSEDLEILISDISLGEKRMDQFCSAPHLFPDNLHPSGVAQNIIFDFLIKNISDLNK